jgi:hypothetical protein
MMNATVYRNTKTTLPGWVSTVHIEQVQGMAYETDTHFVHFYGRGSGLWVVSTGLTATEKKNGLLIDWVSRVFGADQVKQTNHPVGTAVAGVWRPALPCTINLKSFRRLGTPRTNNELPNRRYVC